MNSLLSEVGYEGVTFEEVARRAGTTPATLRAWVAAGALLLVRLNVAGHFARDSRTALADLVLLTPLFALIFSIR
mgnify:CR=1 FL=1